MRTVGCLSVLTILASASPATAQSAVPPPSGFASPTPAVAPSAAPSTSGAATPASAASPSYAAAASTPSVNASTAAPATPAVAPSSTAPAAPAAGAGAGSASTESSAAGAAQVGLASNRRRYRPLRPRLTPADEGAFYREQRELSLSHANTLSGGVGLLHMQTAFSGASGTFRTSFISGYYSGSKFLCPKEGDCIVPADTEATTDEAETVSSDLSISATLLPYLEGYAAMHSVASSNTLGDPELLQVVGDTNFGVKLFSPVKPDRLFAFGANLDLWLLNGTGMLGVDNANFTMRALAGVDFAKYGVPERRVPIRLHTMLGYLFDGSGGLVEKVEDSRGGNRISRIERFGLDINRVDSVLLGFGAEYDHRIVQPFVEWNFDIANNRQDYRCSAPDSGRAEGDSCLKLTHGFSATPSRLTIGTRITPGLRGLSGLLAFDIGTGATSDFIEEVAPELPWKFYFGIAFAHDITSTGAPAPKPAVVEKVVQLPPPPEYRVVGLVLDDRSQEPVPNAIVKFQGQNLTGMVARPDGSFETTSLQPGTYSFAITAEGYRDGQCQVTVMNPQSEAGANASTSNASTSNASTSNASTPAVSTEPTLFETPTAPAATAAATPGAPSVNQGPIITNVACPLKALPPVGSIQGVLLDAETNAPIANGRLTVRDPKGRELTLEADGSGAFRFENVPAGTIQISAEAAGYLPQNIGLDVRPRAEQRPTLSLNPRPKKASVVVTAKEVKLTRQVNFGNDSAVISPDSMGLVQEIAMTLREHPELTRIEIQGHTDNSGTPAYNKRLSQERAEAVRNALVSLGIDGSRLSAVGYGQDKPLSPNDSEPSKAKNRRVQLMVLERQ